MRMNKEVVMVNLSDIIPNRFQPRLTFDEEALNELANSIKEHGIIQPLILRDLGSKYEIIAGERRYKASTIAGLTQVPAIIGTMDDQTSAELALIENIQRKDLSAIEEAKSYKKILDMASFTQDQLAKRMGKSQSTIANKMRLLTLTNEVQMALMNNLISERHARCLLQVKDEDTQKEVLNKIITERMNVRDTDEYVKSIVGNNSDKDAPIVPQEINPANEIAPTVLPVVEPAPSGPVIEPVLPVVEEKPVIDIPKVDESKVMPNTNNENPNVYAQDKNDFINIDNLTTEINPINDLISKLNAGESVPTQITEDPNSIYNPDKIVESPSNDLNKVKLATAIKLAKDAVDTIKSYGYEAVLEEKEELSEYQMIIKVQK